MLFCDAGEYKASTKTRDSFEHMFYIPSSQGGRFWTSCFMKGPVPLPVRGLKARQPSPTWPARPRWGASPEAGGEGSRGGGDWGRSQQQMAASHSHTSGPSQWPHCRLVYFPDMAVWMDEGTSNAKYGALAFADSASSS